MKTYKFRINGKDYSVDIETSDDNKASITVNGRHYEAELPENEEPVFTPVVRPTAAARETAVKPVQSPHTGGRGTIVSPLPGVILKICVHEGQEVKKGDTVAILEAMKMENEINAGTSGKIKSIMVGKGDSVLEGAVIATII